MCVTSVTSQFVCAPTPPAERGSEHAVPQRTARRNHEAPHRPGGNYPRVDDPPAVPGVAADWLLSPDGEAGAPQDDVDGADEQPRVQIRLEERHLSPVRSCLWRRGPRPRGNVRKFVVVVVVVS